MSEQRGCLQEMDTWRAVRPVESWIRERRYVAKREGVQEEEMDWRGERRGEREKGGGGGERDSE